MDNKINEIRRKISFLRSEMLNFEDKIRRHISRDEDCSAASLRMMEMRVQMTALIRDRNALGGHERMLNVDESRLPGGEPETDQGRLWAVVDDPVPLRILRLRAEIRELGGAILQLRRSGLDSATAELLITRKRAELENLTRAKSSA